MFIQEPAPKFVRAGKQPRRGVQFPPRYRGIADRAQCTNIRAKYHHSRSKACKLGIHHSRCPSCIPLHRCIDVILLCHVRTPIRSQRWLETTHPGPQLQATINASIKNRHAQNETLQCASCIVQECHFPRQKGSLLRRHAVDIFKWYIACS